MAHRFDGLTKRARKVLTLSREEAARLSHNYIGTEHLLLGLVREGVGMAARVLTDLGVEHLKVRSAVESIVGRGETMIMGEVGLTPRARRVIALAVDEARRLDHRDVGTGHPLLGLAREGEGIGVGIIGSLGMDIHQVRSRVEHQLAGGTAPSRRRPVPCSPRPIPFRGWRKRPGGCCLPGASCASTMGSRVWRRWSDWCSSTSRWDVSTGGGDGTGVAPCHRRLG